MAGLGGGHDGLRDGWRRLRFAEVDNVAPFNMGVDNVDITVVPEPSASAILFGALPFAAAFLRNRRN